MHARPCVKFPTTRRFCVEWVYPLFCSWMIKTGRRAKREIAHSVKAFRARYSSQMHFPSEIAGQTRAYLGICIKRKEKMTHTIWHVSIAYWIMSLGGVSRQE